MNYMKKSPFDCTVQELDRELIARGVQEPENNRFQFKDNNDLYERKRLMTLAKKLYLENKFIKPDETLRHVSTKDLVNTILYKTGRIEVDGNRGIWGCDERVDYFEIEDEPIIQNAAATAAIFMKEDLQYTGDGFVEINMMNYGQMFNLCESEPFHHQPAATGKVCTGFLVADDMIATAGHCVKEKELRDLRVVFGYRMVDVASVVNLVPESNVYHVEEIIDKVYNPLSRNNGIDPDSNGEDWALIKLNRNTEGRPITRLSSQPINPEQFIYVMGHPLGLPLKYAPGSTISNIKDRYFIADLDVYCGSSGSPVFDAENHEVIGLVVRGDERDFRWTGKCWISVVYPNPINYSEGAHCTLSSMFSHLVNNRL